MPPSRNRHPWERSANTDSDHEDINIDDIGQTSASSSEEEDQAQPPPRNRARTQTRTRVAPVEHHQTQIAIPDASTSSTALRQLLANAQITISDLQTKNHELTLKVANLEEDLTKTKSSKKSRKKGEGDVEVTTQTTDLKIALCGRKFGVMNDMFITGSAFSEPRTEFSPVDPTRYNNEENASKGMVSELWREVPEELHELMAGHTSFRDTFLNALKAHRRHVIGQLRKVASVIFERNAAYYVSSYSGRAKIPEFVAALRFPTEASESNKKFSKFAPILYPNGIKDQNKLFKCLHLALIVRCMLFGPSSITSKTRPTGPERSGDSWGVTYCTPGILALAAVLAIFLHSPDTSFEPKGAISNIDYQKLYNRYKRIWIDNLMAENPRYGRLLKWYNDQVFPWNRTNDESEGEGDGSSGIEDAQGDTIDDDVENEQDSMTVATSGMSLQPAPGPADNLTAVPADRLAAAPADRLAAAPADRLTTAPADRLTTAPADRLAAAPAERLAAAPVAAAPVAAAPIAAAPVERLTTMDNLAAAPTDHLAAAPAHHLAARRTDQLANDAATSLDTPTTAFANLSLIPADVAEARPVAGTRRGRGPPTRRSGRKPVG